MVKYENPFSKKNKDERELRRKESLYVKQDSQTIMNKAIKKQEAAMKKQIDEIETLADKLKTRVLPYSVIKKLNEGFNILLNETIRIFDEKPNLFLDEDKDLIMASVTNIKGIITLIEHKYTEPKQLIDTVANSELKKKMSNNIIQFPKDIGDDE
ncbi:MAG: hypothetical protein IJ772_05545 [Bacilli bacterium]|nr:hypothetical protein [Bacilli bacterium]